MSEPRVTRVVASNAQEVVDIVVPDRCALAIDPVSPDFQADVQVAPLQQLTLVSLVIRSATIDARSQSQHSLSVRVSGDVQIGPKGDSGPANVVTSCAADSDYQIDCRAPGRVLMVTCDSSVLHEAAARLFGEDATGAIDYERPLPDGSADSQALERLTLFLWNEVARGTLSPSSVDVRELENALINRLVASLHGSGLQSPRDGSYPERVRRALQHIEEHLDRALRVSEIADVVGVSAPTLARAFRKHVGQSPVAYARRRRLDQVRRELFGADSTDTSVKEVAERWGFRHTGEFSRLYAREYGEAPSATLRR